MQHTKRVYIRQRLAKIQRLQGGKVTHVQQYKLRNSHNKSNHTKPRWTNLTETAPTLYSISELKYGRIAVTKTACFDSDNHEKVGPNCCFSHAHFFRLVIFCGWTNDVKNISSKTFRDGILTPTSPNPNPTVQTISPVSYRKS